MTKEIYVQLLGEGTRVYRPVPSVQVNSDIFQIGGLYGYDPDDEVWKFLPGTFVLVEEQILLGKVVLVATREVFHIASNP